MSGPLKLYKPIKHTILSSCAIILLLCKTDINNLSVASQQLLYAATINNSAQLLCSQQLLFFATTTTTERAFSCMRIIESTSKHHM
ncbi:unnamed protein product [Prunus brigantina]